MKISNILRKKHMTAKRLSEITGIGYSTIQKYSCGQRKPTVKNAKNIGNVLEINWWELLCDEE